MQMDVKSRMAHDFAQCYGHICATLGMSPHPCVTLRNRELFINANKVGASEWAPLLSSIKINESLEMISIQCHASIQVSSARNVKKSPIAIKSEDLVSRLCAAVKDCLIVNGKIKTLSLVGLNLRDMDIKILSKGLQKNKSLTQLSLERSLNGAKHFKDLLEALKTNMRISCVNFSGCSVDTTFSNLLADYIRCQTSLRHDQVWQDGLRYRRPALDSMGGLRRITINDNPQFGDEGVEILCSVVKEDIWIKALDVQNCNITDVGGQTLLKMLELNAALVVVDARRNVDIDSEILQKIRHQCRINWGSSESEFKWLNFNGAKNTSVPSQSHIKSAKSTTSMNILTPQGMNPSKSDENHLGIPWRAARRANRGSRNISSERKDAFTPCSVKSQVQQSLKTPFHQENGSAQKEMDCEVQNLKDKVKMLTEENSYLQSRCRELERKQIETEETLDVIENSFTNFHKFLDTLRHLGLGHLITMAKLNDTSEIHQERGDSLLSQFKFKSLEKDVEHFNGGSRAASQGEERNETSNGSKKYQDQGMDVAPLQGVFDSMKIADNSMVESSNFIKNDEVKEFKPNSIHRKSQEVSTVSEERPIDLEPEASWFDEFLKTRERLKSIDASDYSLNFDSVSTTNGNVSSDDQFLASREDGSAEKQSHQSYIPSVYLKEDDLFSVNGDKDPSSSDN